MKNILIVTDICLRKSYNSGGKAAVLTLVESLRGVNNVNVDILHFHYKKSDEKIVNRGRYFWRPDLLNLLDRKIRNIFNCSKNLLSYKNSLYKRKQLNSILSKRAYDHVIVEYLEYSFLLDVIHKYNCNSVCDIIDIMTHRKLSFEDKGITPKDENLKIDLDNELMAMSKFDCILAIEDGEYDFLKERLVNDVRLFKKFPIVQYAEKLNKLYNKHNPKVTLGFLGGAASFNVDSINEFIEAIWNTGLYKENIKLVVAGSVSRYIKCEVLGDYENIGIIDSVCSFYQLVDIAINPILYGSGLKTKNAESLLYGVPIITNTLGGKGFEMVDERYCIILDNTDLESYKKAISSILELINKTSSYHIDCYQEANSHFSVESCFKDFRQYLKC